MWYLTDAFIAAANAVLYGSKASASATAASMPMKTQSSPSGTAKAAPAGASASGQSYAKNMAKRDLELIMQTIHESNWEDLDTRLLCPAQLTACPIVRAVPRAQKRTL